jgi:hypothetical protein
MKNKKYVTGLVIAVAGLVLALAPTAQADITLQDGHTGPYRIAFNTTGHYTAISSTITEYDALVEAEAQGTSGDTIDISDITGWKVIGSTVGMNARVNTDTVGSGGSNDVPIYNVNGVRIADGNATFWNTTFGAYDEDNLGPGFYTFPTADDHLAFILHVNGNNPGGGNRTWTGTLAGGGTNTGNELGDITDNKVGQADNRQLDAKWATWGPAGNPSPNTHPYLLYGMSPVINGVSEPSDLAFTRIHLDPVSDRLALQWASRDEVLYDLLYSNDPTATFDPTAWSILTNGVSGTESSTEIFLPDFQGQSWSMVAPWWVFRLREQ